MPLLNYHDKLPMFRYTQNGGNVFATVLDWPEDSVLVLNLPQVGPSNEVTILGYPGQVEVCISVTYYPPQPGFNNPELIQSKIKNI